MIDQPQVNDWGDIISPSGVRLSVPTIPAATLALDQTIESNGLPASTMSGIINAGIGVGQTPQGGYVKIDGQNNRILVNDGNYNIILIGYKKGAF